MRLVLVGLLFLLFTLPVHAVLSESSLKVFAVAPDGTALDADLQLKIVPGNGTVWSSVSGPLVGTATQSTEKIAVKVARNYFEDVDLYDYFFSIDSEASVVDGPSAGSAMALLVVSALQNKELSPQVGLTGTITNMGEVGPVGGVFEKAKEASKNGIKLFLIPQGESKQVVKFPDGVKNINLPEYAMEEWGMKVVETGTLDDVLHYAFADIESIDISETTQPETPVYIPPKLETGDAVKPMGELNKKFIEQTRVAITQAQGALNQTLLDDVGLIEVLSRSLDDSEKTVNEAELLTQNGYHYSAGNYAFLAKVNAYFVKDVSDNPDLIDLESDLLVEWANELEKKLDVHQKTLKKTVPVEGVEWYIAAQQRLTWAQLEIDKIQDNTTVIVVTEDAIHVEAIQRVQDYEFAKSWYESSIEFYGISLAQSTKGLESQSPFVDYYTEFLENAQNGLNIVSEGEGEDAQRRLNAAILDQQDDRHLSAAMNSASSLALINAILIENDSESDVREKLEKTIAILEAKMDAQSSRYAWARLYLDHAKYYLESANYYQETNQGTAVANSLSSGLSLVLLAENTYEVTKDVVDYYESLPTSRFSTLAGVTNGNGSSVIPISIGEDGKGSIVVSANGEDIPIRGILLALALFLGVVLVISFVQRKAQRTLDTPILGNVIHGKTHAGMSTRLLKVDQLEAQLFAARQGLRHAQHQYSTGKISEATFKEMSTNYKDQIRSTSKELRSAGLDLRAEEKVVMKEEKITPVKSEPKTKKWPKMKNKTTKTQVKNKK